MYHDYSYGYNIYNLFKYYIKLFIPNMSVTYYVYILWMKEKMRSDLNLYMGNIRISIWDHFILQMNITFDEIYIGANKNWRTFTICGTAENINQ